MAAAIAQWPLVWFAGGTHGEHGSGRDEVAHGEPTPPRRRTHSALHESKKYARWQIAGVLTMLFTSMGMIALDGLDVVLFGKDITFGYFPWAIFAMAVYLGYGVKASDITGTRKDD